MQRDAAMRAGGKYAKILVEARERFASCAAPRTEPMFFFSAGRPDVSPRCFAFLHHENVIAYIFKHRASPLASPSVLRMACPSPILSTVGYGVPAHADGAAVASPGVVRRRCASAREVRESGAVGRRADKCERGEEERRGAREKAICYSAFFLFPIRFNTSLMFTERETPTPRSAITRAVDYHYRLFTDDATVTSLPPLMISFALIDYRDARERHHAPTSPPPHLVACFVCAVKSGTMPGEAHMREESAPWRAARIVQWCCHR